MTKHVLEVVEFKLNDGVTTEAFLAEIQKINSFMLSFDGFIERHTAQNDDGLWIDVVKWRDMQAAQDAIKQFETAEEAKAFSMMVNFETAKMQHFEVTDYCKS